MAIFRTGPITGAISGDIGGVNFSNTKGSSVLRKKRTTSPNLDIGHALAQSVMATMSRVWRTLEPVDQDAWTNYAKQFQLSNRLGVARVLSGYQMFMKVNMFQQAGADSFTEIPPENTIKPAMPIFSLISSIASGLELTATATISTGIVVAHLYGHLSYSTSLVKSFNRYKFLAEVAMVVDTTISINLQWQQQFSLPVLNQVIGLKVIPTSIEAVRQNDQFLIVKTTA